MAKETDKMTMWEKIVEAQANNKSEITFIDENGKEVKITLKPTKWIERP